MPAPGVEPAYKRLGRRICFFREKRRMRQDELADEVGLGRTSIVNIEAGKQRVLIHHVVLIAEALKVPFPMLLKGVFVDD